MKALQIERFADTSVMQIQEVAQQQPTADRVRAFVRSWDATLEKIKL